MTIEVVVTFTAPVSPFLRVFECVDESDGGDAPFLLHVDYAVEGAAWNSSAFVVNEQYHIVATVNESGVARYFVNGDNVGQRRGESPELKPRSSCYIGKSAWSSSSDGYFTGIISSVKLYSGSMSDAVSRAAYADYLVDYNVTLHRGPRFAWDFRDPTASRDTTVIDSVRGALALLREGANRTASGVALDGVDDYIELGIEAFAPIGGGPMSIVAVVEFTEFLSNAHIFDSSSDDVTGSGITLFTPGTVRELKFKVEQSIVPGVKSAAFLAYSDPGVLSLGQHYHLVSTASAEGLAIYIDGAVAPGSNAVLTARDAQPQRVANSQVYVGKSCTSGSGFFKGIVSSLAIYSVALSAEEVAALYVVHATTVAPSAAPTSASPTAAPTAAPTHRLGSLVNVEHTAIVLREDAGDGPRTLLSVNLAGAPLALAPDEEATVRCATESNAVTIDAPSSHAVRATSSATAPMVIAARGVRDAEQRASRSAEVVCEVSALNRPTQLFAITLTVLGVAQPSFARLCALAPGADPLAESPAACGSTATTNGNG